MASKYLMWKYRDVQPEEQRELTPEQKRKNWWHYHKWHLLIGAALAVAAAGILASMLGIGKVRPDYQIAYVGAARLPDATVEALEGALAAMGEDCNGDGRTVVRLNQYATGGTDAASPYYGAAASTKVMADLKALDSYFFLLEDPQQFQLDYHILRRLDGTLPGEAETGWEDCCLRWADCPTLANLALGELDGSGPGQSLSGPAQSLFSGMYIARRGFWSEYTCDHVQACDALWDAIIRDAKS